MRYLVVIEKSDTGYGAYVPDLPGCVSVGDSPSEVRKLISEAIKLHIKGLKEDGLQIPDPITSSEYVES